VLSEIPRTSTGKFKKRALREQYGTLLIEVGQRVGGSVR
jgi:acyl-CoA synthetase (AMP-forming)/AMP-acid ligase II